jgi:hypothetical protein
MPPKEKPTRHLIWIIFTFLLGVGISYMAVSGGSFAYGAIFNKTLDLVKKEPISKKIPRNPKKLANTLSIGFVGDIIPNINMPLDALTDLRKYTERADLMIGNLEGVTTTSTYSKCKPDSTNCYAFNGNKEFIKILAQSSFDILNVANNHFNDYGETGQEETLQEIVRAGMVPSGIQNEITYLSKNNFKIALIGFSAYKWTTDINNTDRVTSLIETANREADIVIVIFHGGGEGIKYNHTPNETEWYLGENRGNLPAFAHAAIDAGADIVLGSGPHVLRGMEWYNNKLIAYSLGNFISANALSTSGTLKTSAILETTLDKSGSFISGNILPLEIDDYGIPHPDLKNDAIYTINNLSKEDFGKQEIILGPSGEINKN